MAAYCRYIFGFIIFLSGMRCSNSNKPSGLSQGIYCEGCIATVTELLKKVNKKTGESREVRVIEAMEDICNLQNFGSYEYSPPKTGQACKYLIENFDEEIENIMVMESGDFEQMICLELTEACKGVDRSKKEKEELEVNINDKKQKLQTREKDSGQENFHVNINEEGAVEKLVNQINSAIKDNKATKDDNEDDGNEDDNEDDGNEDDNKDDGNEDDNEDDGNEDDNKDDNEDDNEDVATKEDDDMKDDKIDDDEDIGNLTDTLKNIKTEL